MAASDPILTAAEMRAAEQQAIAGGSSVGTLMRQAGVGAAEWVWRFAAGHPVTVLCGPGNNGGDGYVLAEVLRRKGGTVRVVAALPPGTEAAAAARAAYRGEIVDPADCHGAVLVDCLFGTGLKRKLARDLGDLLNGLAERHRQLIAIDVLSGVDADSGAVMASRLPRVDLTLALGALKPAHVLPTARATCGEVRLIDLGLALDAAPIRLIERPSPPPITAESHKYNRGMVGVVAGAMPGAAILAATAAARAGAGYVALYGEAPGGPAALVRRPLTLEALSDERLGAVVVGPGLGAGDEPRALVEWLLDRSALPLVIDADALQYIDRGRIARRSAPVVLTPHYGEFWRMKQTSGQVFVQHDDIFVQDLAEAELLAPGATLVLKGATTQVIRAGEMRVSPRGNPWLSTAGTGDVLAGAIAAMLAAYGKEPRAGFEAAAAGVWLHAEAARRLGAAFIADDLAEALGAARAAL